jgi:hypothetical protein
MSAKMVHLGTFAEQKDLAICIHSRRLFYRANKHQKKAPLGEGGERGKIPVPFGLGGISEAPGCYK